MRGTRFALAASVMATSVFSGCVVERTYEPNDPLAPAEGGFFQPTPIDDGGVITDPGGPGGGGGSGSGLFTRASNGMMKGDIGPARDISQAPERLAVYDDGWYASIESVAVMQDRAAMMMVSTSRPDLVFQAGRSQTFLLSGYGDEEGRQVTVLGCTGASMDYYDEFDVPADEVDVIVEAPPEADPTPGEVVVQVNARWLNVDTEVRSASANFRLQQD